MTAIKTTAAAPRCRPALQDAIALLRADHLALRQLFAAYESTCSPAGRQALVAQICTVLRVQAQIRQEIFDPEVKAALKDRLPVQGARLEHPGVADLIRQLQGATPDDGQVDAKIKLLSAHVQRHVVDAQDRLVSQAMATPLDMVDLGVRLAARRDALLAAAA